MLRGVGTQTDPDTVSGWFGKKLPFTPLPLNVMSWSTPADDFVATKTQSLTFSRPCEPPETDRPFLPQCPHAFASLISMT